MNKEKRAKGTEARKLCKHIRLAVFLACFALLSGCASEKAPVDVVEIALASPSATIFIAPSPVPAAPAQTLPQPIETPAPPVPTAEILPKETPATEKSYPTEDDHFYYQALDDALIKRITGMSFPKENEACAIEYADLRYIGILYADFAGETHAGELIVNRKVAKEVTEIFYALYQNQYPLASVRLVDDFGEPGDDNLSMAANNTSAFNYRRVTGSKTLSRHSYGAAVDINPLFNPYIDDGRVAPPQAEPYADRSLDFPGKIDHDDLCYQLFTRNGWVWGGDWKGDKDYQHFSKDLGY